jgi:hypothetical protein
MIRPPRDTTEPFFVSDVRLRQEEREAARKSEKGSTSPEKLLGNNKEPPLEPR